MRSSIWILMVVCIVGSCAHFQCIYRKNQTSPSTSSNDGPSTPYDKSSAHSSLNPNTNGQHIPMLQKMLDLQGVLTLEGLCFDLCNNCSGEGTNEHKDDFVSGLLNDVDGQPSSNGLAGDVTHTLAPLMCLAKEGIKITRYQVCVIPCILNLTALDSCQIQAIVAKLEGLCPSLSYKGVCVSACLCCGDSDKPQDLCVEACLSRKAGNGTADIPLIGDLPNGNILKNGTLAGLLGKQGPPDVNVNVDSKNKNDAGDSGQGTGNNAGSDGNVNSGSGSANGNAGSTSDSGNSGSNNGNAGTTSDSGNSGSNNGKVGTATGIDASSNSGSASDSSNGKEGSDSSDKDYGTNASANATAAA